MQFSSAGSLKGFTHKISDRLSPNLNKGRKHPASVILTSPGSHLSRRQISWC